MEEKIGGYELYSYLKQHNLEVAKYSKSEELFLMYGK
jgi:hypothetical protein